MLPPSFAAYLDDAIEYMEENVSSMPDTVDFFGRYDQYIIFLKSLSEAIKNNTGDYTRDKIDFHNWFTRFDEIRKLNFKKTFPEYIDFWDHCSFPITK